MNKKKVEGNNTEIEDAVFIIFISLSKLNKQLQSSDGAYTKALNIPRMKFVENVGTKIKLIISKSNPWSKRNCECNDSPIGREADVKVLGSCKVKGVIYEINVSYWVKALEVHMKDNLSTLVEKSVRR